MYDVEMYLVIGCDDIFGVEIVVWCQVISYDLFGDLWYDGVYIGVVVIEYGYVVKWQVVEEVDEGIFQVFEIMVVGFYVIGVDIGDD